MYVKEKFKIVYLFKFEGFMEYFSGFFSTSSGFFVKFYSQRAQS